MYPLINDKLFYKKINDKYHDYKIKNPPNDLKTVCYPKKYKLQPHQLFAPAYINPRTPYSGVLLYYGIGAGKSCASIRIAEEWIKKGYKIIVVVPASLKGNYRNEIRSLCTGENYLMNKERDALKTTDKEGTSKIISLSDKRIDEHYTIYSYNGFITGIKENEIKLNKTVLIIDEIQNLVSEYGTYYQTLYAFIKKAPTSTRIVLLSATPIFDKPVEIALTLNLLQLPKELPTGRDFYNFFFNKDHTVKNLDIFKERIKGFVSYYRGAPEISYPKKVIHYVKCTMDDFQYKAYLTAAQEVTKGTSLRPFTEGDISELPDDFLLGLRMISNVAFPNKNIGAEGFSSFSGNNLKHLKKYSIKFYKIMNKIKHCYGPLFIYSGFREYGGIEPLIKVLEYNGYVNYQHNGVGKKRYAIWSGQEKSAYREEFKAVFNRPENVDGSLIKIIIGSPSIKEGVSLFRVKQVHILEPYWNMSRIEQVIGRAVRFCSHKDVPSKERLVEIFIYIAVHGDEKFSVDYRILNMALQKIEMNMPFELALKEASVDCYLNKEANGQDIVCEK